MTMFSNKPVEIKYTKKTAYCDCGSVLKYTGTQLLSNPPQYVHKCEKCDSFENLDSVYPRIEKEIVEIEDTRKNGE